MKLARAFGFAFTVYALFWNLGAKPLAEWDESRYGQIALEMLRTCDTHCDFINYYYNGNPDFWTAKPPLNIWSILISYKVFGLNEFAMRFPSAIAGIIALYFLFQFLSLYLTENYVWFSLAVAVTTKSLIGPHISRSGDTDAYLLASLFAFLFFYARFFQKSRDKDLLWAGLALGIAFFAKGFAIAFFGPVGLFFLLWKSGWKKLVRNKFFYAGGIAFLVFPLFWFIAIGLYGNKNVSHPYMGGNAVSVMVFFDIVDRFNGSMDPDRAFDPGFLLRSMEIRFGMWWLLFCFWGLFSVLKKFGPTKPAFYTVEVFQNAALRKEATLLATTGLASIFVLLFFSVSKNEWYLVPVLPFFCLLFIYGYEYASKTHKRMADVLCGLSLVLAVVNQVQYVSLDEMDYSFRDFVAANKAALQSSSELYSSRRLRQIELLYVSWVHQGPVRIKPQESAKLGIDCSQGFCLLSVP